jgi:hypothetical protein
MPVLWSRDMACSDRWHERTLEDGGWLHARFGRLTLVVFSTSEEWRVAALHDAGTDLLSAGDPPADDLPWQRWDRAKEDVKLRFRPVFPDRPVVIRPQSPLNLSPRAKALFYVGIPAFIELAAHSGGQYTTLRAWPSDPPTNTWHGTPVAGTLCHSVKTRARRRYVADDWKEMSILSTIEISNTGSDTLPFERLFFETGHLGVFEHGGRLWSNHARIRTGERDDPLSGVIFGEKPHGDAAAGTLLTPPRLGKARRSFLKEAFSSILGSSSPSDS